VDKYRLPTHTQDFNMDKREVIMLTISDLVGSFLYYDRKEDEELGRGEIEKCIESGDITVDEIVNEFKLGLENYFEN